MIKQLALAGAATVAVGAATWGIVNKASDEIAAKHPEGSAADTPAAVLHWSTAGVGFVTALAGVGALTTDRVGLAIGLGIAGAGLVAGGIAGGITFRSRHGIGVESEISRIMDRYDDNDDDRLSMDKQSWWRGKETTYTYTTTTTVNGTTTTQYHTNSIHRLAAEADANDDRIATLDEVSDVISGYDQDGNGRLQADELDRFDDEVGEE